MDLTFIVPLYNEEKRVVVYLPRLFKYLKTHLSSSPPYTYEIILVNDGSIDGTWEKIRRLKTPLSKIINLKKNQGKGAAIKRGVEKATGKYIFFTDIDLSVDLLAIKKSLSILRERKAEVVIGSRRLKKSRIIIRQNKLRENLGWLYTKLATTVLGLALSDLTCGFKGFEKKAAKKVFPLLKNDRWSFDAEVLYLLKKLGFKIEEVPVIWKNNPDSKVKLHKDALISFIELLKIRIYDFFGLYVTCT